DGGDVALVVAVIAGVAARRHVEVGVAALGGGEGQRRGALLVEALGRGQLGPAAGGDLGAVGDRVLVHHAVEAVAVDVAAVGMDGRRGGGVAGAAVLVDLASAGGAVRLLPHDVAAGGVERDDVAGLRGHEDEIARGAAGDDVGEHDRRAVGGAA